jgi:hypothetical protein
LLAKLTLVDRQPKLKWIDIPVGLQSADQRIDAMPRRLCIQQDKSCLIHAVHADFVQVNMKLELYISAGS